MNSNNDKNDGALKIYPRQRVAEPPGRVGGYYAAITKYCSSSAYIVRTLQILRYDVGTSDTTITIILQYVLVAYGLMYLLVFDDKTAVAPAANNNNNNTRVSRSETVNFVLFFFFFGFYTSQ